MITSSSLTEQTEIFYLGRFCILGALVQELNDFPFRACTFRKRHHDSDIDCTVTDWWPAIAQEDSFLQKGGKKRRDYLFQRLKLSILEKSKPAYTNWMLPLRPIDMSNVYIPGSVKISSGKLSLKADKNFETCRGQTVRANATEHWNEWIEGPALELKEA